jgi:hypothetical protein
MAFFPPLSSSSEGLGEVFKGDSTDTCAGKFSLVSMGGRVNGQACADGERGPPSVRAEIMFKLIILNFCVCFVGPYLVHGPVQQVNLRS